MALNIGNLNFGVDANTQGLQKAVAQLAQFQRQTDKVAKSQVQGAQRVANAMGRQESAVKKAFQETLRLQQQLRKAGVPPAQLAEVSNAFRILTRDMTSGKLSAVEFGRATDAFNAKLGRSKRALADLGAQKAGKKMAKLNEIMRDLESSSVLAIGPLSGLGARIRALGAIAGRSTLKLVALFAGVTAGIVVLSKLAAASVRAFATFEEASARFEAASGSVAIANKQMAFVIKTSNELGLRIDTAAKAFSRLTASTRGTKLEGEGTRRIFLAVSKAAAALRLGAGEVEGTFRAIEQIMSKGSVQAEELRGQLGERLPGAFRIAAESMGVTTKELGEMLKAGEVLSDDFMPKFTAALEQAFGEAAKENVNSFRGSLNLAANASLLFATQFDKLAGVSTITVGAIQAFTAVLNALTRNLRNIIILSVATAAALLGLAAPAIFAGIITLTKLIAAAARAVLLFNFAILANPVGGFLLLILRLTLAAVAFVGAWFGMNRVLDDSASILDDLNDKLAETEGSVTDIGTLSKAFEKLKDEIQDTGKNMRLYRTALREAIASGRDLDDVILQFETIGKAIFENQKEIAETAAELSRQLKRDVAANITAVTKALVELAFANRDAQQAAEDHTSALEKHAQVMVTAAEKQAALNAKLAALREGPDQAEFFAKIESKVNDYTASLDGAILSTEELNAKTRKFRDTLFAIIQLQKEQAAQRKKERDEARVARRVEEAIKRADAEMKRMQERLKAMAQGPEGLKVFERVTEPLLKFEEGLRRLKVPMEEINRLSAQRKVLLEALKKAEEESSKAGEQAANAIVNSLENVILKTESVKDALRSLARELFRILLRATLLDPLLKGLTSGLGNIFQAGGITAKPNPFPPGAGINVQHGGLFKVGGTGGVDTKRVAFNATPGELINIRRPDQAGGVGGNINITVNAPGADEGTVARVKEIVRVELVPSIVETSMRGTIARLNRPRFA